MVQAKKGSLAGRGTISVSHPNDRAISIPKSTTVSKDSHNKHKGR